MAKIIFIDFQGTKRCVEGSPGQSVMDAARKNSVPGIVAMCGGSCACGTCHVYVDEEWVPLVGVAPEQEREMLDYAFEVQSNSRLSCQIKVTAALDGLVVRTPSRQE
ncbi:2Fe-2S iron-sulfur cluster binding domain-containing protein [Pseudomonas sp. Z1-14]|uniref:2Fe-2S iron-sulfur cluster-binding protein n=1 Tax=Pseudomonas sp. Z1-14 TaxID=2817409 RepID=UPI003DA8474B